MEGQKINQELQRKSRQQLAKEKDPIERFRLRALETGCSSIKGIGRKFRLWDQNNDKTIGWDEFKWVCLNRGMKDMSDEYLKTVFRHFDRDGSGRIDFDEFLITVRPHMNERRKKLVKSAFAKMDKTGDGIITVEDLIETYDVRKHPKYQNGEMTERQVRMEFLKTFDVDDHTKNQDKDEDPVVITLEEWINYYSAVSASIDDDVYFELMMINSWKL